MSHVASRCLTLPHVVSRQQLTAIVSLVNLLTNDMTSGQDLTVGLDSTRLIKSQTFFLFFAVVALYFI